MEVKRQSWFWPVQLSVWILIGIFNYVSQARVNLHYPVVLLTLNFIGTTVGCFLVTTAYRYYYKRQPLKFTLSFSSFVGRLLVITFLLLIAWLIFNILLFLPFFERFHLSLLSFAGSLINVFILLLGWNLFYLAFQLVSRYHINEIEKWKLQAEVQKAQLGNLKAQINPHFIFNALNNIRAMILEDHQQAREMLTKFSEILRYALKNAEDAEITIAQELEMLQQYLDLVKVQYEERLVFSITAAPSLLGEKIPPMILQLLVENAVKHGIALSRTGGAIHIAVEDYTGYILLIVKNTGTLKNSNQLEENLGVGLNNITERLKLIYGDKASITMEEKAPDVIVMIKIDKKR